MDLHLHTGPVPLYPHVWTWKPVQPFNQSINPISCGLFPSVWNPDRSLRVILSLQVTVMLVSSSTESNCSGTSTFEHLMQDAEDYITAVSAFHPILPQLDKVTPNHVTPPPPWLSSCGALEQHRRCFSLLAVPEHCMTHVNPGWQHLQEIFLEAAITGDTELPRESHTHSVPPIKCLRKSPGITFCPTKQAVQLDMGAPHITLGYKYRASDRNCFSNELSREWEQQRKLRGSRVDKDVLSVSPGTGFCLHQWQSQHQDIKSKV